MLTVRQGEPGRLLVGHPKLTQPIDLDAARLERWLLRLLRDATFSTGPEKGTAAEPATQG